MALIGDMPLDGGVGENGEFRQSVTDNGPLECIVCNTEIFYGGRGPKPKYCDEHKTGTRRGTPSGNTSGGGRHSADVTAALASMEAMYGILTMLLSPLSPVASAILKDGVPAAQMQNRLAFENDRALARSISSGAAKGGKAMFIATNAMLIGPVVALAYKDVSNRSPRKPRQPRTQTPPPAQPTATPQPGGSAPGNMPPAGQFVDPVDMAIARAKRGGV